MDKSRKYNSYKGKVGKIAKNRLARRFSTPVPLQKLVTDITEFKCLSEEKLYLNPILDLYNEKFLLMNQETSNIKSCHGILR
jgi:putative transposase